MTAKATANTAATADTIKAWPFLICYVLFPLAWMDHYGYFPFSPNFGPIFVFGFIPLFDHLFGLDLYNPPTKVFVELERRFSFRIVALLFFPAQLAFLFWAMCVALPDINKECGGDYFSSRRWWGLVFNVGVNAGLGINMGHELIHKKEWYEHWSGCACLCLDCYGHFAVEHLDGHHRRVATRADPATSRLNEWVFVFWVRSIVGGFVSAFMLKPLKCTLLWATTILFSIYVIPKDARSFFYLQGAIGILYLETVNYIEHYGLTRKPNEAVTPMHSWNAGYRTTNYFLLKLQRHSDHHAYAGRRYQSLRSWPWSPQLPSGYATMIILALFPPLWFSVMNPRVEHAQRVAKELEEQGHIKEYFTDEYLQSHDGLKNPAHWY